MKCLVTAACVDFYLLRTTLSTCSWDIWRYLESKLCLLRGFFCHTVRKKHLGAKYHFPHSAFLLSYLFLLFYVSEGADQWLSNMQPRDEHYVRQMQHVMITKWIPPPSSRLWELVTQIFLFHTCTRALLKLGMSSHEL